MVCPEIAFVVCSEKENNNQSEIFFNFSDAYTYFVLVCAALGVDSVTIIPLSSAGKVNCYEYVTDVGRVCLSKHKLVSA